MNKSNMKILIFIIGICILISLLAYFLSNKFNNDMVKYNSNFIVDGEAFWEYKEGKWNNLVTIDNLDWKKYKVYSGNNYIDKYYITMIEDKTYFFDKNNNSYDVEYPYIAINSDSLVTPVDYKKVDINKNDNDTINSYLKQLKINYNGQYSELKKYVSDLNNDEKDDYIYILSNELYSENNIFYLVFARINNKNFTLNKQINQDNYKQYDIGWILNIKSNKFNDIILKEVKEDFNIYYLYSYNKKNGYIELFS